MYNESCFIERLESGMSSRIDVVKVQITRRCNLRCKKCCHWKLVNPGDLIPEKLKIIIDKFAKHGCSIINFVGGEPTLYKGLPEIIEYATKKDIKCGITTNGQIIDEVYIKCLKKAGLKSLRFSLDSHVPSFHDYLVGVPGAWLRSVDAIKIVRKHIRRLSINSLITALNFVHISKFLLFAFNLGVKEVTFTPYDVTGDVKHDCQFLLKHDHIKHLNQKLIPDCLKLSSRLGIDTNFSQIVKNTCVRGETILSLKNEKQINIPCFLPFYRVDVDRLGNVFPCCKMRGKKKCMGNIFDMELSDIVNGEKFKQFKRKLIPPLKHEECSKCWVGIGDNLETMKNLRDYDNVNDMLLTMIEQKCQDS